MCCRKRTYADSKKDKVLTTRAHYAKQKGKSLPDNPYSWNESTIAAVLDTPDNKCVKCYLL